MNKRLVISYNGVHLHTEHFLNQSVLMNTKWAAKWPITIDESLLSYTLLTTLVSPPRVAHHTKSLSGSWSPHQCLQLKVSRKTKAKTFAAVTFKILQRFVRPPLTPDSRLPDNHTLASGLRQLCCYGTTETQSSHHREPQRCSKRRKWTGWSCTNALGKERIVQKAWCVSGWKLATHLSSSSSLLSAVSIIKISHFTLFILFF